mgnify:CR=1 FL=1
MPRLQTLAECLGAALCEHATAALARLVPFETAAGKARASLRGMTVEDSIQTWVKLNKPPIGVSASG